MEHRRLLFGLIFFVLATTLASLYFLKDVRDVKTKAAVIASSFNRGLKQLSSKIATTDNGSRSVAAPATSQTRVQAQQTPVTNRPLLCQGCFSSNFSCLVDNPGICSPSSGTDTEMIIIITSSTDGLERRQAIRDTWASVTKGNTAHVRHMFLLGTSSQGTVSNDIKAESSRFKDVVVADFVDSYGNLTFKTMVGMHWIVSHCGQAKFFVKTDQDMYNFPERILDLARKQETTLMTSIGGACHQTAKPWRDPRTKYYASIRSYPQSTYPGFCSGTGYVSTLNVARKIVETSPNIPFFHLEDVYLSLLLRHVGYKLTRYPGFLEGTGVCKDAGKAKQTLTIHEVDPATMRRFWESKCGV